MDIKENIDFVDDFLMRCEDWLHGEDGMDCTIARKKLSEILEQLKNNGALDDVEKGDNKKDTDIALGNTVVYQHEGMGFHQISMPLENENDAESFVETMKEGRYYKTIRPDIKLVTMKIIGIK